MYQRSLTILFFILIGFIILGSIISFLAELVMPFTSCDIKGTVHSKTIKYYHLPYTKYYKQSHIDLRRGERWFCSEETAKSAGFKKAPSAPSISI